MRGRVLRAVNWRYAVGEVALIVIGILIALAASDWKAQRDERRTELSLLGDLHAGLSADLVAAREQLDRYRRIAGQVEELLAHLHTADAYTDEHAALFGAPYGFGPMDFNRAAYESIKSQGLDLVSDAALRSALAHLYEQAVPLSEASVEVERGVVFDLLRPYYLEHFRDLRFNKSAAPLDHDAILADTRFLNLVDYRLQVLLQNHIPQFERLVPEIEAVLRQVAAELDEG